MKKWIVYVGLFLLAGLPGCSDNQLASVESDVTVTVRGESPFGEWQRAFVGPASQAEDFAQEAVGIVSTLAEKFSGSIDMEIAIDEKSYKSMSIPGKAEDIVPAAILAAHDITALRLGFMPQGSVDDLAVSTTVAGKRPCTCVGEGCCCTWTSCGNIWLSCDGCGRNSDNMCIAGTQCWGATGEEN